MSETYDRYMTGVSQVSADGLPGQVAAVIVYRHLLLLELIQLLTNGSLQRNSRQIVTHLWLYKQ